MSLIGKVAIVTGGTKGVGQGIGADLPVKETCVRHGRSAPDHKSTGERTTAIRCDHCIDSEVEAAFKLIGVRSGPSTS